MVVKETSRHQMAEHDLLVTLTELESQGKLTSALLGPVVPSGAGPSSSRRPSRMAPHIRFKNSRDMSTRWSELALCFLETAGTRRAQVQSPTGFQRIR